MRTARCVVAFVACMAVGTDLFAQMSRSGLVSRSVEGLHPATNALGWVQGVLTSAQDDDCLDIVNGGYTIDYVVSSYMAYYGDATASIPKVGDIYYCAVVVTDVATCRSIVASPYLILPANTQLAISTTNPVYCYLNGTATTTGCSQNPPFGTSLSGAQGYDFGLWNLHAGGGSIEIHVPVVSTSSTATYLRTRVDTADGGTNPFLTPQVGLIPGSNPPVIAYPATSTTLITNTTSRTTADLYNYYTAGTIYFDLGTSTAYGTSTAGNAVSGSYSSVEYYTDWSGLNPGTTYHWRARFVPTAGATVNGADQSFTTTGTVTVPPAPNGLQTAAVAGGIDVTWNTIIGASSYDVYRRDAGSTAYNKIGSATNTIYHDTTLTPGSAYLYRVRATNGAGSSADSVSVLATYVLFTDNPLVAGTTIKAVHLSELRTAVNGVRALAGGFPSATYTDTAAPGVVVKAVHIKELRTQLDPALIALGIPTAAYTNAITAGIVISAIDFQEIRDRVK
jgi:hypothetical protein